MSCSIISVTHTHATPQQGEESLLNTFLHACMHACVGRCWKTSPQMQWTCLRLRCRSSRQCLW